MKSAEARPAKERIVFNDVHRLAGGPVTASAAAKDCESAKAADGKAETRWAAASVVGLGGMFGSISVPRAGRHRGGVRPILSSTPAAGRPSERILLR
jgi:hypothetical protein